MKSFMRYNTSGLVIVGLLLGVAIGSQTAIGALWGGLSGVALGVLAVVGLRRHRDARPAPFHVDDAPADHLRGDH